MLERASSGGVTTAGAARVDSARIQERALYRISPVVARLMVLLAFFTVSAPAVYARIIMRASRLAVVNAVVHAAEAGLAAVQACVPPSVAAQPAGTRVPPAPVWPVQAPNSLRSL